MSLSDLQHLALYLQNHWREIAAYSIDGLSISILLQWMKRRFNLDQKTVRFIKIIRLDGPRIVVVLLTVLTTIGTAVSYLVDPVNAQYIPKEFSFLLVAAFFIHRFMVSPLGQRLEKSLKPYWLALEQMKQNEEKTLKGVPMPAPATQPFTLDQQK